MKKTIVAVLVLAACAAAVVLFLSERSREGRAPAAGSATFPAPAKADGCVRRGSMPDPACTPGAVFPEATRERVCARGYAGSVRHVTAATKRRVFRMYGEAPRGPGSYEVDHLVSLELGGSNDVANLWPEPAEPRPGFHEKDEVENRLHREVCAGRMPLAEAQRRIANDWHAVYAEIHPR